MTENHTLPLARNWRVWVCTGGGFRASHDFYFDSMVNEATVRKCGDVLDWVDAREIERVHSADLET